MALLAYGLSRACRRTLWVGVLGLSASCGGKAPSGHSFAQAAKPTHAGLESEAHAAGNTWKKREPRLVSLDAWLYDHAFRRIGVEAGHHAVHFRALEDHCYLLAFGDPELRGTLTLFTQRGLHSVLPLSPEAAVQVCAHDDTDFHVRFADQAPALRLHVYERPGLGHLPLPPVTPEGDPPALPQLRVLAPLPAWLNAVFSVRRQGVMRAQSPLVLRAPSGGCGGWHLPAELASWHISGHVYQRELVRGSDFFLASCVPSLTLHAPTDGATTTDVSYAALAWKLGRGGPFGLNDQTWIEASLARLEIEALGFALDSYNPPRRVEPEDEVTSADVHLRPGLCYRLHLTWATPMTSASYFHAPGLVAPSQTGTSASGQPDVPDETGGAGTALGAVVSRSSLGVTALRFSAGGSDTAEQIDFCAASASQPGGNINKGAAMVGRVDVSGDHDEPPLLQVLTREPAAGHAKPLP